MGGTVFLYPGQGSQKVGMGADLQANRPELFDRYLGQADAASGLPISRLCLEGPIEALTETQVAQPALFALSLALTEYAQQAGLRPDFVAGHSLGEYTAAVVAGALSVEDGMRLVALRGKLMAAIQTERPGAMAAIIGLATDQLSELCDRASEAGLVSLANLNSPSQTVVSGEVAGVTRLVELAHEAGATRAQRLSVGAGFHSALMQPVQTELGRVTDTLAWHTVDVPLAANASGSLLTLGDDIHRALLAQIVSPVRWVACVQSLLQAGATMFLELGSGRVLTGLVRQISPGVDVFPVDSPQGLDAWAASRSSQLACDAVRE
jgi:[acyl-carrier-protein] S-malonyltransferase